jgi:hypothetical protein
MASAFVAQNYARPGNHKKAGENLKYAILKGIEEFHDPSRDLLLKSIINEAGKR